MTPPKLKTLSLFAAAASLLMLAVRFTPVRSAPSAPPARSEPRSEPLGAAPPRATAPWPRTVALVLDRSGSMGGALLERARQEVLSIGAALGPGDWVTLVSYADDARIELPLTSAANAVDALGRAMDRVEAAGPTDLGRGIAAGARRLAAAPGGTTRQLIVIGEGRPNHGLTDPTRLEELVGHVRERGIRVSAVALGEGRLLERLSRAGGGIHAAARPEPVGPRVLRDL